MFWDFRHTRRVISCHVADGYLPYMARWVTNIPLTSRDNVTCLQPSSVSPLLAKLFFSFYCLAPAAASVSPRGSSLRSNLISSNLICYDPVYARRRNKSVNPPFLSVCAAHLAVDRGARLVDASDAVSGAESLRPRITLPLPSNKSSTLLPFNSASASSPSTQPTSL